MSVPFVDRHLVVQLEFFNYKSWDHPLLSEFHSFPPKKYLVLNVGSEDTKIFILSCSIAERRHSFCFRVLDIKFHFQGPPPRPA